MNEDKVYGKIERKKDKDFSEAIIKTVFSLLILIGIMFVIGIYSGIIDVNNQNTKINNNDLNVIGLEQDLNIIKNNQVSLANLIVNDSQALQELSRLNQECTVMNENDSNIILNCLKKEK